MRNVVHHVQARNALLVQIVNRVRVFFAKNCYQDIGTNDFFFATASGLHMHDGALNHTLKTQGRLCVNFFCASHLRRIVCNESG